MNHQKPFVQLLFLSLVTVLFSLASCQQEGSSNATKVQATSDQKATIPPKTDTDTMAKKPIPTPKIELDSSITLDYIMGKFDPARHKDFSKIEPRHASRTGMYLRNDAYAAFKEMYLAAKEEGIKLAILSATRNFASQKRIWEAKWNGNRLLDGGINAREAIPDPKARGLKILEWSSMPGSSRHHWGTDIDINALNNSYFTKGKGLEEYKWLQANAARFGFCQTYSPKGKERPYGYNEEKWHWSFLPYAKRLSDQAQLRLKDEMIKGFDGSEVASEIGIVKKYVLGINTACL
ncbi:MAG: M15 family metallopeptidase [Bacteroidota bacterium]